MRSSVARGEKINDEGNLIFLGHWYDSTDDSCSYLTPYTYTMSKEPDGESEPILRMDAV